MVTKSKPHFKSIAEIAKTKKKIELYRQWSKRARPILQQMIKGGHGINRQEFIQTLDLLKARAEGDTSVSDPSVAYKSHLR
jgi:hypothetical protein